MILYRFEEFDRSARVVRVFTRVKQRPKAAPCGHKNRISEVAGMGHVTYEVCADCGHRFV